MKKSRHLPNYANKLGLPIIENAWNYSRQQQLKNNIYISDTLLNMISKYGKKDNSSKAEKWNPK